jgi:4-hydroxy-tetrahydrodipicolinate reductase
MKIALIGYGKMGHAIEAMATGRGHTVACRIDRDDPWPDSLGADVAIEFSTPATAADNLRRCLERGVATVGGTTGWYARYDEVCTL